MKRLMEKWQVSKGRLILILITFAMGGSLTGYLGRKVLNLLSIENTLLFILCYIIIMTLIWPFAVLTVSLLTGQASFFIKYLGRLMNKFRRS